MIHILSAFVSILAVASPNTNALGIIPLPDYKLTPDYPVVTIQALSHKRYIETFRPEHHWAAAKAFISLIGYAGALETAVCQARDYITGNSWSGRTACAAGSTVAAIGRGFAIMENFKTVASALMTQTPTGYRQYAIEPQGGAQMVDNPVKKRGLPAILHPDNTGGTFDALGMEGLMADPSDDSEPTIYVGGDIYTTNEVSALEWDLGTANSENNGFADYYDEVVKDMNNEQVWEQCACYMENNQWTATTSIQYSWDNTYNGYSELWNTDCDGA
ncbi:uncharacterized protein PAC_04802 [Phialocephala subalpina]|uniref:Uncharacterized protein n=1 Tax=Phialocephala subalpina TaxID=576137 RepID=A0A1L7WQ84_9HELO|nr:uncharacterized protein PAC_04802 [Phialocephala subalpina]